MYFTATVSNETRKRKENLDNFNELQEFMVKMQNNGFKSASVAAFNQNGPVKTVTYCFIGGTWKKIKTFYQS